MRKLIGITHRIVVELALVSVLTHVDVIADRKVPRHLESHIAVVVGLSLVAALLTTHMLGLLHILIDVGLHIVLPVLILVATLLLVLFLIHLLTSEALDEVHHLFVVQRIGEVLRNTLESADLTLLPVGGMIALHDIA